MKNIGLKIFSLVMAAMLSYYIHSDSNEGVIGVTVPVELKGLSSERVIIYPLVRQVQVSIKGPSYLLSSIYASPPAFHIKVPDDVENKFTAILAKKDLAMPPSVEVLSVEPSKIEFSLDKIIKKIVPVQVTQIGTVSEGYKITSIMADPSQLTLSGPQTELMNISRVETEPIDLRDITSDTEREISVRFIAKQSEVSSNVVKVRIKVTTSVVVHEQPQVVVKEKKKK